MIAEHISNFVKMFHVRFLNVITEHIFLTDTSSITDSNIVYSYYFNNTPCIQITNKHLGYIFINKT